MCFSAPFSNLFTRRSHRTQIFVLQIISLLIRGEARETTRNYMSGTNYNQTTSEDNLGNLGRADNVRTECGLDLISSGYSPVAGFSEHGNEPSSSIKGRIFLDQLRDRSPCGGGIEYLHRDPASRRRRRKGKSQI
jgi:hypothetical protein